jgi:hypothetical protein
MLLQHQDAVPDRHKELMEIIKYVKPHLAAEFKNKCDNFNIMS